MGNKLKKLNPFWILLGILVVIVAANIYLGVTYYQERQKHQKLSPQIVRLKNSLREAQGDVEVLEKRLAQAKEKLEAVQKPQSNIELLDGLFQLSTENHIKVVSAKKVGEGWEVKAEGRFSEIPAFIAGLEEVGVVENISLSEGKEGWSIELRIR